VRNQRENKKRKWEGEVEWGEEKRKERVHVTGEMA